MTLLHDLIGGRYRLTGLLGRGGMADVYRAVDERTERAVALKLVRSGDPELSGRFVQEVRALGRFDHPGLVRLLGSGVADDQPYLVMELIDGPTLAARLRDGPLTSAETADLGSCLAGALAYVHHRGIVHRDVKPGNILFGSDGAARLTDFGIARLLDTSTLTVTGTTLGTAAYMAPEQLEGHGVGPPADIWSLGMVLLECITGRRLYEGSPSEVVARRLAGPLTVPDDLPGRWPDLLRGMLAREPEARPDGAAAARWLSASPTAATWGPPVAEAAGPPEPAEGTTQILPRDGTRVYPPSVPPRRRRRYARWWWSAAAALLAGALCLGLVLASSSNGPPSHKSTPATTPAPSTTAPATTAAPPTTAAAPAAATAPPALAALQRDVGSTVAAGDMTPGAAAALDQLARQAVNAGADGQRGVATSDLQLASTVVTASTRNGSLPQPEAGVLTRDLSNLAAAIGAGPPAPPPPGPQPGPPGGHHHHGHGS